MLLEMCIHRALLCDTILINLPNLLPGQALYKCIYIYKTKQNKNKNKTNKTFEITWLSFT